MKREQLEITLQDAEAKHAKQLLDFYRAVGAETEFLDFDGEGIGLNQEQEQRYLKRIHGSWHSRLLLAMVDDEIIGVASIAAPENGRQSHVGEVGIVLKRRYWGIGLSRVLMQDMMDWAIESPALRYITLTVDEENIAAQKLYDFFEFETLGRIPGGTHVDNGYRDCLIMGRSVVDEEE
ncbi:MAG: GNAT family N-acetyltransferase [Aerococcus sp.]|nr:GNAT family N-acetyltransferase [Aerococcus sp.]